MQKNAASFGLCNEAIDMYNDAEAGFENFDRTDIEDAIFGPVDEKNKLKKSHEDLLEMFVGVSKNAQANEWQLFLKDDNTLGFGSRTRELTLDNDNGGFYASMLFNKNEYNKYAYLFKLLGFDAVKEISKLKNIEIEGIFTHFATADEENEEK